MIVPRGPNKARLAGADGRERLPAATSALGASGTKQRTSGARLMAYSPADVLRQGPGVSRL